MAHASFFLELTARPEIGALALADAPAVVFSHDGTRILWANAPAADTLGAASPDELIAAPLGRRNPIVGQIARLAGRLPSDGSRVEMLRVANGTRLSALPASCRRLNLADGGRVVLAILPTSTRTVSLRARAEAALAGWTGLAPRMAIVKRDGGVLAGTGDIDWDTAAPAIERVAPAAGEIATIELSQGAVRGRVVRLGNSAPALFLVFAEPLHTKAPDAAAAPPATGSADRTERSKSLADLPEGAQPPTIRERAVRRFVWAATGDGIITDVAGELADVVGFANAALDGRSWDDVAKAFDFDLPPIDRAWVASVMWPVADTDTTIAADLSGVSDGVGGSRGFGVLDPERTGRDTRPERITLGGVPPTAEAASVPPDGLSETAPEPPELADFPGEREPEKPATGIGDDVDDAARRSVETAREADDKPTGDDGGPPGPNNIVRLPGAADTPSDADRGDGALVRMGETLRAHYRSPGTQRSGRSDVAMHRDADADTNVQAVLDRVPIGLMVLHGDDMVFANRRLIDMLLFADADALAEAGGAKAVFPDHADAWTGQNLTADDGRLIAVDREGNAITVKASLHTIDWQGSPALMLALRPDRTEEAREEIEAELHAALERVEELEAVLDTATDGTVIFDSDGAIAGINRAGEALFGVDSIEMHGLPFTDLLAEESRQTARDYLDGLTANGVASVLNDGREVIGRVPDGGLIPLFMTMGRIGQGIAYCAVLRDITQWKTAEEQLVAARREAEEANEQKSEYLAKISHEIRTPLNAIIGFSEVMTEQRFGELGSDRYRSYARDIHTSGQHMLSLINDLLDLSKIEAGKLELDFEAVPLNAIVQEVVGMMQPQANGERIIIRTSLSGNVPEIVADTRSLRQILLNLLSNAIKFTAAGGQVIVSTGLEESGEVVLRVRDTGVGMSPKDVQAALEPFRQVASPRQDEGTGLGLPLTKALAEANRAVFEIDSAVGQGTLVKVTFPTTRVLAG